MVAWSLQHQLCVSPFSIPTILPYSRHCGEACEVYQCHVMILTNYFRFGGPVCRIGYRLGL